MAHLGGVITAPVRIADLQAVVPVTIIRPTGGGSTQSGIANSLNTIIGANVGDTVPALDGGNNWTVVARTDFNKWAKYKPVRSNIMKKSDQWDYANNRWKANSTWWKAGGMCGLETIVDTVFGNPFSSTTSWAKKLINGQLGWSYTRPSGGLQTPYRLTDFAQYNHYAIQPYGEIGSTNIYVNAQYQAEIDWEVISVDDLNLQLADFAIQSGGSTYSLTDMYLGIILWSGTTYHLYTSSTKFGSGASLHITLSNLQSMLGTWNCMPFFTKNQVNAQGGFDANGLFISMADTTPISITLSRTGSTEFEMPEGIWNEAGTRVNYTITIVNTSANAFNFSSIIATIMGGNPSTGDTLGTVTLNNITVNGNSTRTLTGYITCNKTTYDSYWIRVRDGNGASTIQSKYNQVEDYDPPL